MISKQTSHLRVGNGTFSADVVLNLHIGEICYELGHLGPGFAMFSEPQEITANEGEIESVVDGDSLRQRVRFTKPITKTSKRFEFELISKPDPSTDSE